MCNTLGWPRKELVQLEPSTVATKVDQTDANGKAYVLVDINGYSMTSQCAAVDYSPVQCVECADGQVSAVSILVVTCRLSAAIAVAGCCQVVSMRSVLCCIHWRSRLELVKLLKVWSYLREELWAS